VPITISVASEPLPFQDEASGERGAGRYAIARLAVVVAVVLCALATSGLAAGQDVSAEPDLAGTPQLLGGSARASSSDRWNTYLADEATCPGARSTSAPLAAQARTLNCLINHARAERGVKKLRISRVLTLAARHKAEAIQRCQVFDHAPCGGRASDVAVRAGYSGRFAETLYLGEGSFGSPHSALAEWLHSPAHREQIFSPRWQAYSVYAVHVAELDGMHDATLWVAQFGDR
jgi:uncharacterized protein YkwD